MGSVRITGPGLDSLGTEAEWTNPGPEEAQQKAGAGAAGKGRANWGAHSWGSLPSRGESRPSSQAHRCSQAPGEVHTFAFKRHTAAITSKVPSFRSSENIRLFSK